MKKQFKKLIKIIRKWMVSPDEIYFYMRDNPNYQNYEIGEFTYGNPIIEDNLISTLKIGKYCSIAGDVRFILGGNHRSDWISTYPFSVVFEKYNHIKGHPSTKGDIIIGNDVWIGTGALIMSGVTIGDGAIIGAKSVVTKDIAPYSVSVGCPARVIKYRFDNDKIENLLKIKWWNYDSYIIEKLVPQLLSEDIDSLIVEIEKIKNI
jgi:virginiamycin A acetyltransferase